MKSSIRDHRDLRVWRKSRKLAELCQEAVELFPAGSERIGKAIWRLAVEVPEEIEVGQSQGQHAPYMSHLERSRRALRLLERQLINAHKSGCLPAAAGDGLLTRSAEIDRMLGKLMVSLELADAQRRVKVPTGR
jgi:four helix bundle protein